MSVVPAAIAKGGVSGTLLCICICKQKSAWRPFFLMLMFILEHTTYINYHT